MSKKKIRGLHRKTNDMISRIEDAASRFPTEFHYGYWNLPLPADQSFINSSKTPFNVKRRCIQTLVGRAEHLSRLKPENNENFRVVVSVSLPDLWKSQLIIFEGNQHFDGFFTRDIDDLKWIPLPRSKNLQTEWGIPVPKSFQICGFTEIITDKEADYYYEGEIWFIGEL